MSTFDQLKSQAVTLNEDDVQLRALERDAKSQRDLLESYLTKYREATARDSIATAPADARVISRATVSNVPAYPKKLPTVLIATLATLVLSSGLVLTRELLASPGAGAAGASMRRRQFGIARPVPIRPRRLAPAAMSRQPQPNGQGRRTPLLRGRYRRGFALSCSRRIGCPAQPRRKSWRREWPKGRRKGCRKEWRMPRSRRWWACR